MYSFEEILIREENGSKKWNPEYISRRFPNYKSPYYPLFIADMDYRLPSEITDKFIEFIQRGDFGYFDVMDEFRESVNRWYKTLLNRDIEKEWVLPGIGTISSINFTIKSLLNEGDKALIFTPVYGPFRDVIVNNNLELVTQSLDLDNDKYLIDFDKLESNIISQNIKCILFCNPHNPSGRVWSKEELTKLVRICKKYDLLLISDEVHSDLVLYENKFTSLEMFFNEYDQIIVSSSPNKTFNLAGLNASYLLIPNADNYNKVEKIFSQNKIGINRVGYKFLMACYSLGESWVKELRNNIEENIELVTEIISNEDLYIMKPQSGYLVWIKLNKVEDTLGFVEALAKETGVLVEVGSRFVGSEDGYIRINLATSKEILKISMNKFVEFYNEYIS